MLGQIILPMATEVHQFRINFEINGFAFWSTTTGIAQYAILLSIISVILWQANDRTIRETD